MADDPGLGPATASRQKSCNACVKAKRGCDKRYPTCSRCEEKHNPCMYTKRTHSEAFESLFDFDFDSAGLDMPWEGTTSLSSSRMIDNMVPNSATSASLDTSCVRSSDALIDRIMAFSEDHATPSRDMQLVPSADVQLDELCGTEQTLSHFDYTAMADVCMQYEPWQVYDPNTKVHYIIETLKSYPRTFAKDNYTSWMHRYLYNDQMPSSVRSCFTVSTLYSNMTSNNKTSVFRVLCQSLDELKEQRFANTPQEKLARVQALFLYQIICLFDGDLTLRSNADREMAVLQDWVDELCKIRKNLKSSGSTSSAGPGEYSEPPRSWGWWVFAESVRRTIVIAYAFIGLWSLMCKNNDDAFLNAWKYQHCWTISRSLWEAPSSFDFFLVWKSKAHHVNENFEFENFLKFGTVDDVDDFSKLLMVAYMGLDETKQWFADKGSVF